MAEFLRFADPGAHGFSRVVVWGGQATLAHIENRPWLDKRHLAILDRSLPYRVFWQRFRLSDLARQTECDVLLVPGGSYAGNFMPVVVMCRNMLPFEWRELKRYGLSAMALKLLALRWSQSRSFHHASGIIFLTRYAKDVVTAVVGRVCGVSAIIPHGVNTRFSASPRQQQSIDEYSEEKPFRILYVSQIDWYKHQWHVVEAVAQLRKEGLPVALELVGPACKPAIHKLAATIRRCDPYGRFVSCRGSLPHTELNARYTLADLCLFGSSCENMPNTLLEGMASGLPLACSNKGPMPEVLGPGGVYFDPEKPDEIAGALRQLIASPALRERMALTSSGLVKDYSWRRCSDETLGFLATVAKNAESLNEGRKVAVVDWTEIGRR